MKHLHARTSALALVAALALVFSGPAHAQDSVEREGRVGTITATIDGEERTFPVIGQVTGEHTLWGSAWEQNGPRVGMSIWGVTEPVAEADNQDDNFVISLTYRLSERSPSFDGLTRECDPFGDRVTVSVDDRRKNMIGETCGGIEVESLTYDEASETFTVRGAFEGELEDGAGTIRNGIFEATLSRLER